MSRLLRLMHIVRVALRYRLHSFIPRNASAPRKLRLLLGLFDLLAPGPEQLPQQRGERLRNALEDLGPIFVKFGQLLSTRRDLLPDDIADQLALLQDRVPAFDSATSVAIIEQALGQSVTTAFAEFDATPLASASVAQVHAATMHDGQQVVVKVIRPGIEDLIARDIALLFTLARWVEKYSSDGYRLKPVEIVDDYQHTIFDELDLKREAANCSQLKRNFDSSEELRQLLFIPAVIWAFSGPRILVLERIYGIPVSDIDTLKARGTDLKLLAERGVEIFFTQVFEHNFFHADMHPGNIFVDASEPASPKYIGIDCAIMGSLSDFDRYYLARNLLAVFNRDYELVAQLHIESGWVPPGTNIHAFSGVIRSACEPVFEKPLSEISFGTLLIYLFQAARRFGMEVQPSLVLLQKTLLNIEGLGRQLYPDLDLWQTAHPFLEQWMAERYSPQRLLNELKEQSPALLEALPALPNLLLRQLHDSNSKNGRRNRMHALDQRLAELEQKQARSQRLLSLLSVIALLSVGAYLALH